MKNFIVVTFVSVGIFFFASISYAGFDWSGGGECSGSGNFEQPVYKEQYIEVGSIPAGKEGIIINLKSDRDVDIQIYDKESETIIVGYPDGILNDRSKENTVYENMTIEWSGYKGDCGAFSYETYNYSVCDSGTSPGNEYIKIDKTTRELVMRVYGWRAGEATVDYSWDDTMGCSSDTGQGSFFEFAPYRAWSKIGGTIAKDVKDVSIFIISTNNPINGKTTDVDIQLLDMELSHDDGSDFKIVEWPNGILNGISQQSANYNNSIIEWTGYNGFKGTQISGRKRGIECVQIHGTVPHEMRMRAYGYEAGKYQVFYTWGMPATMSQNGIVFYRDVNKIGAFIDEVVAKSAVTLVLSGIVGVDGLGSFLADFIGAPGAVMLGQTIINDLLDTDDYWDLSRIVLVGLNGDDDLSSITCSPNFRRTITGIKKEEVTILAKANVHPNALGKTLIAELYDSSDTLLDKMELFTVKSEHLWKKVVFFTPISFSIKNHPNNNFNIKVKWDIQGANHSEEISVDFTTD